MRRVKIYILENSQALFAVSAIERRKRKREREREREGGGEWVLGK